MRDLGNNNNQRKSCCDGACECHDGGRSAQQQRSGVSRRSFMQTIGLSAAAGALSTAVEQRLADAQQTGAAGATKDIIGPDPAQVVLRINGQDQPVTIDPAMTLMEALRWNLRMTGTKEICDRGACGGCSVLIDGELIASCMLLAIDAVGTEITTIEGVANGDTLDPIQEAFIRHDALQCGYCTPGLILAAKALLNEKPRPTLEEIKHGLSGNICRCGTYTNIFNAVLEASGQKPIVDDGMFAGGAP